MKRRKSFPRRMPIDANRMATNARNYLAASDRLMEFRAIGEGKIECFPVQAIVLAAFALELALKALWTKNGKPFDHIHNTEELFDGLLTEQRSRLQREAEDALEISKPKGPWILAASDGRPIPPEILDQLDHGFRRRLEDNAHAFEDVRYHFEYVSMDAGGLGFISGLADGVLNLFHASA